MKRFKVCLLILILVLIIGIGFPLISRAARINPDDYKSSGPTEADVKSMYVYGGSVAGAVQVVGTIVSAGAMIIIGIRYVMASADEKAEYRERMIPYFIGAVLLFGASNIVNIVYKMFK